MVFSIIKQWLTPVLGSLITSMRSSQKLTEDTPREIRTFGAGSKQSWRGRGPPSAYPITNITFNESEERIVNEIKMQDAKSWGHSYADARPSTRSDSLTRSASTGSTHKHGNNIRKDVEVAITTEVRDLQPNAGGNNKNLAPQNFSYVRGPRKN